MSGTHRTALVFSYDTVESASVVHDAISVEAGAIEGERTRASVERDGRDVRVEVHAADLTALRAGTNTWTTLVSVAESAADAGRRHATQYS